MAKYRMEQVNSELQKAISVIINNELRNPVIDDEVITITEVVTSADLSQAKVYISILGDKEKKQIVLKEINSSKSFIKKSLAKEVNLRKTPELIFILDESLDNGERIMKVLEDLKKKGSL